MAERMEDIKVLVVDDNQINLFVINKILEDIGILADCVPNGKACIKKCTKKQYDLIFMDHMMPDMDGVETFNEIRQLPDFDTPVVILTANTDAGAKASYEEIGFVRYIAKPIDADEVRDCIEQFVFGGFCARADDADAVRIERLKANGFEIADKLLSAGMGIDEFEELLQIFLEESGEKKEACDEFAREKNLKDYAIIVHGLKNDAAMISDMSLSEHAKSHELESKAFNEQYVADEWEGLKIHWEDTIKRIKNYFQ